MVAHRSHPDGYERVSCCRALPRSRQDTASGLSGLLLEIGSLTQRRRLRPTGASAASTLLAESGWNVSSRRQESRRPRCWRYRARCQAARRRHTRSTSRRPQGVQRSRFSQSRPVGPAGADCPDPCFLPPTRPESPPSRPPGSDSRKGRSPYRAPARPSASATRRGDRLES